LPRLNLKACCCNTQRWWTRLWCHAPDDRHGESVVAFVVRRKSDPAVTEAVTAERIKAFIADRVAEYKRVSEVHFVDAIPKSASGKILRRVLRDQLKNQ